MCVCVCISRLLRTKCVYKNRNVFSPLVSGSESDLNEVILSGYRSDLRLVYKLRHIPLSLRMINTYALRTELSRRLILEFVDVLGVMCHLRYIVRALEKMLPR